MHAVSIHDHPANMNARARISQPIKNDIYVNEWLFVLFTSQVISNISKIIYFSAQIFAGWEFNGTVQSTVYVEQYGTEYGLSFTERDGVQFRFFCAVRFRTHIFRPVSLSSPD